MARSLLNSNIEFRKDDSGAIDDVVVRNPTVFKMERMNDNKWWYESIHHMVIW
jgi:hypothetical protein